MEIIAKIKQIISGYKDRHPKAYQFFHSQTIQNEDDLCLALIKLFEKEEIAIEEARKAPFVTDTLENEVMSLAVSLDTCFSQEREILSRYESYDALYKKRHMAYAFFHNLATAARIDQEVELDVYTTKLALDAYPSLAEFYVQFYGKFADNEEAIQLLCRFFPKESNYSSEKTAIIAQALHSHMRNAGTLKDFGYAYNGISLMKRYVKNLPKKIIDNILKQYRLYDVLNGEIIRNQILTLITASVLPESTQRKYKFWYLDSLLIADKIDMFFYRKRKETEEGIKPYYLQNLCLEAKQLDVLEKPVSFWKNKTIGTREFFVEGKLLFSISLIDNEIVLKNLETDKNMEFPFDMTDWRLKSYGSRESEQLFHDFVFSDAKEQLIFRQMKFSLLYLNEYRGMKSHQVNFDHQYDYAEGELKKNGHMYQEIPHFYGKAISSLSCIVGMNGTGKSSTVEFLRLTFFRLLKLIMETDIIIENGYIAPASYMEYEILDEKVEFAVVFYLDKEPFYLTNISGVKVNSDVKPFQKGTISSINEISKLFYFSSQQKNDIEPFKKMQTGRGSRSGSKQAKAELLNDFKLYDYSEMTSFAGKIAAWAQGMTGVEVDYINLEICYQLTFLKNYDRKKLCKLLDGMEERTFYIKSDEFDGLEETFRLADIVNKKRKFTELVKRFARYPDSKIEYFSSGEYAKFSFLSKLFWILGGYECDRAIYEKLFGKNFTNTEAAIFKGETAIIFIDEGEVYYHPEWQRQYIDTLFDMIESYLDKECVQIIITTNSPFILSDVRNKDVTYLTKDAKGQASLKINEETFAQNIHKLLRKNTFMEYTIGEYARTMIQEIISTLQCDKQEKSSVNTFLGKYFDEEWDSYEAMTLLIEQIGEPVYRYNLEKALSAWASKDKRIQIQELENEKRKLEEKIKTLKG